MNGKYVWISEYESQRLPGWIWDKYREAPLKGVEMRRIGRAFYDDTDEGERVVVIPLDGVDGHGSLS